MNLWSHPFLLFSIKTLRSLSYNPIILPVPALIHLFMHKYSLFYCALNMTWLNIMLAHVSERLVLQRHTYDYSLQQSSRELLSLICILISWGEPPMRFLWSFPSNFIRFLWVEGGRGWFSWNSHMQQRATEEGLGFGQRGIDGVREETGIFRGRREALSRDSHR